MAHRSSVTGNKLFVYVPGAGCFRAGGENFSFAKVADEIRSEPWAARTDDGDVVAGPGKAQVARHARHEPTPGAGLAALLAP
jgi:hypothetical protein